MTKSLFFPDGIDREPVVLKRAKQDAEVINREAHLQRLAFEHPEIIPIDEIDPGAKLVAPLCRELTLRGQTGPVYLDMLGVTRRGRLVLVECKLWRNPQARREVIGQVLEYAGLMRRLSYGDLSELVAVRTGCRSSANLLWELAAGRLGLTNEAEFVDAVSNSLAEGAFDLVILGDGIRSEIDAVRGFLEAAAGLRSRLALVEIATWTDAEGRVLLTPQIALRTKVIEHQAQPYQYEPAAPSTVRTAPDADNMATPAASNRAFWDQFIAKARFSHPDQPQPTYGGNNWVRLAMPIGNATAYRSRGPEGSNSKCGIFLNLPGDTGRMAYDQLVSDLPEIEAEVGASLAPKWDDAKNSGSVSLADPILSTDENAQLTWLLDASDRVVSALRPRLSALI